MSQYFPLAPLTASEVEDAVKILHSNQNYDPHFRFISIQLAEPGKDEIWREDISGLNVDVVDSHKMREIPRKAFMVILNTRDGKCWEATVNISTQHVTMKYIPDVQPPYTPYEYEICESAVKTSPLVLAALAKRGVHNVDDVMIDLWAGGRGFIGEHDDPSKRLAKPLLYLRDMTDTIAYGYGRPIHGVNPVVDLNTKTVIELEDLGVIPITASAAEQEKQQQQARRRTQACPEHSQHQQPSAAEAHVPPLRPLNISQPEGASFTVDGHHIKWQGWDFHVGFNAREGLTLHAVRVFDRQQSRLRPVLWRGSCVEMVVPYADPTAPTYRRNAFDVGEEGLGFNANSLELGCDCLGHIHYLDAVVNTNDGHARVIKNAICIHEEDYGVLWKHTDWRSGNANVARSRRLVLSFFVTIANYDYGFYWYLYQDGAIASEVKLTGIVLTSGLLPSVQSGDLRHGTLLRPGLLAPYHQHFFSFRLEMAVDGLRNSLYEVNAGPDRSPAVDNVQGNAFTITKTLLRREGEAQRRVDLDSGRYWLVANRKKRNIIGEPTAYRLVPADNSVPYLNANSPVYQRAGFVGSHLWATVYDPDQLFPSGSYPNQPNFRHVGLPTFILGNRVIDDCPLVLWYTLGVLHIPRLEDWPIMPVVRASFSLQPDGFFDANPSAHLRKTTAAGAAVPTRSSSSEPSCRKTSTADVAVTPEHCAHARSKL